MNRMNPMNWKKPMFISRFIEQDKKGIRVYDLPLPLTVNYQPVSAEIASKEVGVFENGVQRALLKLGTKEYDMFEIGVDETSVAYLDGASPEKADGSTESFNGEWANYEVVGIRVYNITKHVYFRKLKGR